MIKTILNSKFIFKGSSLCQKISKINLMNLKSKFYYNEEKRKTLQTTDKKQYVTLQHCLSIDYYMKLINSQCSYKEARILLSKIVSSKISLKQFQSVWKKYNYYVCKIYQKGLFDTKQQLFSFLDQITSIHQKYHSQLTSQNLTKVFNKLTQQFLSIQIWKGLNVNQKIRIIQIITRYNPKKAKFVFKNQRKQLYKQVSDLQKQNCQKLLFSMNKMNFFDTFLFQFCIDQMYNLLMLMNLKKLTKVLFTLAKSHRYINKEFIIKAEQRTMQLLPNLGVQQFYFYVQLASSFSQIQSALKTHSYFEQLDNLYDNLFNQINQRISLLKMNQLYAYASALRRSMHFDQTMIKSLIQECFRRKIVEFEQKQLKEAQSINLHNIASIFHMLAAFNYRDTKFINYFVGIIQMIMRNPSDHFTAQQFHKILWSICVLFNSYQIHQVFPFIKYLFEDQREIKTYETSSFYYCYLLLKRQYAQLSIQNKKIAKFLQQDENQQNNNQLKVQVSQIQQQVFKTMLQCDIPCILQYNLNNIICDIYVPKYQDMDNLIIQVHGFHHFARNQKRINGSTSLKQKIIQNDGYYCFYISIDEWLIAEDKKQFINDFMSLVKKQYILKKNKIKNTLAASVINPKNGRFIRKSLKSQVKLNLPTETQQSKEVLPKNDIKRNNSLKERLNLIKQHSLKMKMIQE